jgi:hypothetical protein
MKFRKKPVVIEAIQFTVGNFYKVAKFVGNSWGADKDGDYYIKTLEGNMYPSLNDYVIKGVQGEFYPCKPDIFEATYEKVEE